MAQKTSISSKIPSGLRNQDSDTGFTLIELVIVALLLALMAMILFGSVTTIIQGKSTIDAEASTARNVQYVLNRLRRELSCAMSVSLNAYQPGKEEDAQDSTISSLYLLGKEASASGRGGGVLRFVSLGTSQAFFGAFANYGPVEIEYRLEEQTGDKVSRGREEPLHILVREEYPASVTNKAILEQRRIVFPLLENVEEMSFRYLQGGTWERTWSRPRSLPQAVEITLKIRSSSDSSQVYRTAVGLERAQRE